MVVLHVPYMYSYPYIPLYQSVHVYYSNSGITCTVQVLIPIYTPCVRVSMYTIVTMVLHVPYMYSYPYIPLCQSIQVYYSNGGITCTVHVLIPIYTPCVRLSMYTIVTVVLHVPYMYSYPYIPLCQSIHVYYSNGGITCTVHVLIPIYIPCVRVSMYTIVTVVLHVQYMYSYPYIPLCQSIQVYYRTVVFIIVLCLIMNSTKQMKF